MATVQLADTALLEENIQLMTEVPETHLFEVLETVPFEDQVIDMIINEDTATIDKIMTSHLEKSIRQLPIFQQMTSDQQEIINTVLKEALQGALVTALMKDMPTLMKNINNHFIAEARLASLKSGSIIISTVAATVTATVVLFLFLGR